jgi:chemotaxis protein CheC
MIILDERDRDAVRELVNIASGNAASALAQLVGQRTMISVPKLTFAQIEDISSILGASDEPNVVVAMQVLGDVTGCLMFVMQSSRAHEFCALLLGLPTPGSGAFDANGQSALAETANILAGAYAGALGSVLGGIVMISVPSFGVTPPEDLLARFRTPSSETPFGVCIETTFTIGEQGAECGGHMVLLPGAGALESIVSSLTQLTQAANPRGSI